MSNKLKRKALIPAIAMVLVSVVALSGVSYAWFTVGETATVDQLKLDVKAATGIQLSLTPEEPTSWKGTINADDVLKSITDFSKTNNAYPQKEIYPVSTVGLNDNNSFTMYRGDIDPDTNLLTTKVQDIKDAEYIAFDLYIKVDAAEENIKLDTNSGVQYIADAAKPDNKSYLASRIGFINYGNVGTNYGSTKLAKTEAGSLFENGAFIWEPYSTTHIDINGVVSTGEKLPYTGVKGEDTNLPNSSTATGDKFGAVTTKTFTGDTEGLTAGTPAPFLNLTQGISKIRVYIWLEGQDADCHNKISGGNFATTINFTRK